MTLDSNYGKPIYYNNKIIFQGWWGTHFDIYDPQSSTWSIGQFPQNVFIESVILVNNALYAIGSNDYNSGSFRSNLEATVLKNMK